MTHSPTPQRPLNRRTTLALLAGGAAALAGCGGGGDGVSSGGTGSPAFTTGGLSSGGTGSFTSGSISGFGSIIVNGIRYDDRAATVEREDGDDVQTLKVGMVVTVLGSGVSAAASADALPTATASRIVYASEWVGPVQALDATAGTFTLLGLSVATTSSTIVEGPGITQLGELANGRIVEVYGFLDARTGGLKATRIEVRSDTPAAYRLTGTVSALNAAAKTFQLGSTVISTAGVALPAGLANGSLVRVRVATTAVAGVWTATRVDLRRTLPASASNAQTYEAEIEGTVTAFTSASSFSINGLPVDARGVTATGTVALGSRVEVKGVLVNGTLVASRVQEEDGDEKEFRFVGAIADLDTRGRTFSVRGQLIRYNGSTDLKVALANGTAVRVDTRRTGGSYLARQVRAAD